MGSRLGIGGLLIALVAVILMRLSSRNSTGEEYLSHSKELISQIPSHKAHPEYVDWLVTQAHDSCFNDSYTQELGRRGRGGKIHVDEFGYLTDLFSSMITQAESDRQKEIAEELAKLRDEVFKDS